MAVPQKDTYTRDEYLDMQLEIDEKYDFYQGKLFLKTSRSFNNNVLGGNMFALLHASQKGKPCEVFTSDMKIDIEFHDLYVYPDASVICGKPEFTEGRTDAVKNPVVIVEVLSPSTREYDRGSKFTFYRSLPSLKEYIMVDQDRVFIDYYRKAEDGRWILEEITELDAVLSLQSIDFSSTLSEIYDGVDWSEKGKIVSVK